MSAIKFGQRWYSALQNFLRLLCSLSIRSAAILTCQVERMTGEMINDFEEFSQSSISLLFLSWSRSSKPSYWKQLCSGVFWTLIRWSRVGHWVFHIAMRRTQHQWGLTSTAWPFEWKHQWFKWSVPRFLGPPAQYRQAWLGLQHTRYYQENGENIKE